MLTRLPHEPSAYDDDWEDQPAQSGFHKWFLGVAVPVAIAAYGVHAIVWQEATSKKSTASMVLHRKNAVAFGIAWTSAAIFLHCHYFWGNIYDQAWFAVLGKILSACGFIAGTAFVLVRCGMLNIK